MPRLLSTHLLPLAAGLALLLEGCAPELDVRARGQGLSRWRTAPHLPSFLDTHEEDTGGTRVRDGFVFLGVLVGRMRRIIWL